MQATVIHHMPRDINILQLAKMSYGSVFQHFGDTAAR